MSRFALRRLTGFLVLGGTVAVSAALIAAQAPAGKAEVERETAKAVVRLLERSHLSRPRINDDIARKWDRNFLKTLDPQKYYFLQADVDAFLAQDTTLDDKIHEGDVTFAKQVFARFKERSKERVAQAQEFLKQPVDFEADESIVDDPDKLDWPKTEEEATDRLRRRIKYDLLRLKVAKTDPEKALKQLAVRYRDINRTVQLFDTSEMLEIYLSSLAAVIDPHSSYMSWKTLEDMNQQLNLSLEGIGASLIMEDGLPVVKEVIPGAPADKDGRLAVEDKIIGIEHEDGEREDFAEKKLSDVVRKIRGKANTKVRLIVQPNDSKELKTYELTRGVVDLAEQRAKSAIIEAKGVDGKPVKIGVIHLGSFYGNLQAMLRGDRNAASATRDCRVFLDEFKDKGVDVVLMDLRGNPGGLLTEGITLSGLFIDQGPVVQVREASRIRHLDDDDAGTAWDGPLAVVIDRNSASASEIFAGVIKDYGRGLVIGDKATYGKGTVQQLVPLNDQFLGGNDDANLGAMKLTIQQFYRPDGESTQIKGVEPDVHIPTIRDEADFGEGKNEAAVAWNKVRPEPHDKYNRLNDDLVARVNDRSKDRRKESPKFKEQRELIEKFRERKARHEISLNEKKFRAETLASDDEDDDEDKPKKEKDKDAPKKKHTDRPAWESTYYNDEVIAIVRDYVTLGSRAVANAPVRRQAAGLP